MTPSILTTGKKNLLKFLWVQDVHFGVTALPLGAVTQSFMHVYSVAKRKGIKWVVFGGDITDRELPLSDPYSHEYINFINWLLEDAEKNDIGIIGIEGTPSHDWKQFKLFEEMKQSGGYKTRLIYISTLSIVDVEDFGTVLVVPDQWRSKTSETYTEILSLLRERKLEQVDWCFAHGSFAYQVPSFLRNRLDLHDEDDFCNIVKHGIFVGHEHGYSEYQKIHCAGSLERWKHGQEEDKGAFYVEQLFTGVPYIEFIRNEKAQVYRDVLVDGESSAEIQQKLKEAEVDFDKPGGIRLIASQNIGTVNEFVKKANLIYDDIKWSVKDISKKTTDSTVSEELTDFSFSKVNLDSSTIEELMRKRLEAKYPEKAKILSSLFGEIVEEVKGEDHGIECSES